MGAGLTFTLPEPLGYAAGERNAKGCRRTKFASYTVTRGFFAGEARVPAPGSMKIVCALAPRSFQLPNAYVDPSAGFVYWGSAGTASVCAELSENANVW